VGGRQTAVATTMPVNWRVGRPMRVHENVLGVCVEARVELGLEQRRWMAGRTGELGAAATADAGERRGAAPEQCEGGGVAWGVGGA
jgi:hypothetical protein